MEREVSAELSTSSERERTVCEGGRNRPCSINARLWIAKLKVMHAQAALFKGKTICFSTRGPMYGF